MFSVRAGVLRPIAATLRISIRFSKGLFRVGRPFRIAPELLYDPDWTDMTTAACSSDSSATPSRPTRDLRPIVRPKWRQIYHWIFIFGRLNYCVRLHDFSIVLPSSCNSHCGRYNKKHAPLNSFSNGQDLVPIFIPFFHFAFPIFHQQFNEWFFRFCFFSFFVFLFYLLTFNSMAFRASAAAINFADGRFICCVPVSTWINSVSRNKISNTFQF